MRSAFCVFLMLAAGGCGQPAREQSEMLTVVEDVKEENSEAQLAAKQVLRELYETSERRKMRERALKHYAGPIPNARVLELRRFLETQKDGTGQEATVFQIKLAGEEILAIEELQQSVDARAEKLIRDK